MELENMNEIRNDESMVEIENFEEFEPETEEESGLSTLAAMAIGAGITAAGVAVVGLVKKAFKKLKAKKDSDKAKEEAKATYATTGDSVDEIEDADVEDK